MPLQWTKSTPRGLGDVEEERPVRERERLRRGGGYRARPRPSPSSRGGAPPGARSRRPGGVRAARATSPPSSRDDQRIRHCASADGYHRRLEHLTPILPRAIAAWTVWMVFSARDASSCSSSASGRLPLDQVGVLDAPRPELGAAADHPHLEGRLGGAPVLALDEVAGPVVLVYPVDAGQQDPVLLHESPGSVSRAAGPRARRRRS